MDYVLWAGTALNPGGAQGGRFTLAGAGVLSGAPVGFHQGLSLSVLKQVTAETLEAPAAALVNFAVRHPDSSELEEQAAAKKQQLGFHGD